MNDYKIIELEIEFYINFKKYREEAMDSLQRQLTIQVPITRFENGEIYRICPSTEEQAIHRVLIKERFRAAMKHAQKRMNRLLQAYNQLTQSQQKLLHLYYLSDKKMNLQQGARVMRLSVKKFEKARIQALQDMYDIYERERTNERLAIYTTQLENLKNNAPSVQEVNR